MRKAAPNKQRTGARTGIYTEPTLALPLPEVEAERVLARVCAREREAQSETD